MKKTFTLMLILALSISAAFASWSADFSIGPLTSFGAIYEVDKFEFNAKIDTSAGIATIVSYSLADKFSENKLTTAEKLRLGNEVLHGLSFESLFKAAEIEKFDFSVGAQISTWYISPDVEAIDFLDTIYLTVLNINAKFATAFDQHNSAYIKVGFPILAYTNNTGDPDDDYYSGFDFWTFLPTSLGQMEYGFEQPGLAWKLGLLLFASAFRIGYSYHF